MNIPIINTESDKGVESLSMSDDKKAQMLFEYYKQQREEMMHLTQERQNVSFQLLVIVGGLSLGYFQVQSIFGRILFGVIMIAVGVIGWRLQANIETARYRHLQRARRARQYLPCIDEVAKLYDSYSRRDVWYDALVLMIVLLGAGLVIAALLP
jgi:hypothetical protein